MTTILLVLIAVICLSIPLIKGIIRLYIASFSDKITFIKGDRKVTISTKTNSEAQRNELVSL